MVIPFTEVERLFYLRYLVINQSIETIIAKAKELGYDVNDAEGAIYDRELTDILDVLQEVLREAKSGKRVK